MTNPEKSVERFSSKQREEIVAGVRSRGYHDLRGIITARRFVLSGSSIAEIGLPSNLAFKRSHTGQAIEGIRQQLRIITQRISGENRS